MEQGPLSEHEDEVLRYSGVTLQDRDGGYPRRALEERLQMPRSDSAYYDEMGVRTYGNAPQELRAREALLLEQERRLEVERERLLSMRESVVADVTSESYGRRFTESPRPFSSHQAITPEDHPSDCECMRCSQLYTTNVSRQGSNQPLPSPLRRPGVDSGRRLSAGPSTYLGHPGRSLGMSIGNISSPNIVHMSVPPEDPARGGRRRSFDNTKNRDLHTKVAVNTQDPDSRDGRHRGTKSQDFFTKMFMH